MLITNLYFVYIFFIIHPFHSSHPLTVSFCEQVFLTYLLNLHFIKLFLFYIYLPRKDTALTTALYFDKKKTVFFFHKEENRENPCYITNTKR